MTGSLERENKWVIQRASLLKIANTSSPITLSILLFLSNSLLPAYSIFHTFVFPVIFSARRQSKSELVYSYQKNQIQQNYRSNSKIFGTLTRNLKSSKAVQFSSRQVKCHEYHNRNKNGKYSNKIPFSVKRPSPAKLQ